MINEALRGRWRLVDVPLLVAAVALAFADASIVVLALPAIYSRFDSTIVGVSWVLTGYAVAVTVTAVAIAVFRRWTGARPVALTAVGVVLFAAGSAWCGLAGSLPSLLAGRVVQGVGAAGLLSGALVVLCAQVGRDRGRRLWSGAATAGLAVGPALGGALTEAFDWRMIFYGQLPVAVLTLAVLVRAPKALAPSPSASPGTRRAAWANFGYVTLFAGLVGALFLGVLLLVEVWRFSPLLAAAVMTALPAGTLLAARARNVPVGVAALAAGLAGLALLPAANAAWAAAALFVCGAGAGLVMGALSQATEGATVRSGGATVAAKHAGLVLGLVIIAPLLSASLQDGGQRAVLAGTGVLLDARMPVQDKLRLAMTARDTLAETPRGSVPDVTKAVGATNPDEVAATNEVDDRLRGVLTRSFRPAFLAAAGLALLTLVAAIGLRERGRRAVAIPVAVALLAAGLVGAEAAAGAGSYGRYAESQPCNAPADPYPGKNVDALLQRVAYGALNGAACELGMSRERFVLAVAGQPGFDTVEWDTPTVERAVRAAVDRALDDADSRDDLPGWVVSLVHATVDRMPLGRMLELLGLTD